MSKKSWCIHTVEYNEAIKSLWKILCRLQCEERFIGNLHPHALVLYIYYVCSNLWKGSPQNNGSGCILWGEEGWLGWNRREPDFSSCVVLDPFSYRIAVKSIV